MPGTLFLGGLASDMTGTKAAFLEACARRDGRAFLRFDYTGHGASSGRFEDGCIGDWFRDAADALDRLTEGPQVLVGSSMGGWIALLLARARPGRVAGLVGVAAAPDFTEDLIRPALDPAALARLAEEGHARLPSAYDPAGMTVTRRLLEDGARHLVLRDPLPLPFPVRLLHGTADAEVPQAVALRLLDHATGPDLRLTLVKGADHRLSEPADLALLDRTLAEVLAGAAERSIA